MSSMGTIAGNVSTLPGDNVVTNMLAIQLEQLEIIVVELRKINAHFALINDHVMKENDVMIDHEDDTE